MSTFVNERCSGVYCAIDIDKPTPRNAQSKLVCLAMRALELQSYAPDSCPDCADEPFGGHVKDLCGLCLYRNDTVFNQLCGDCRGIPNGPFVVDDCGVCVHPLD